MINKTETKKSVTIICPVHNEELAVPLFYKRIMDVLTRRPDIDFEIIFTNNRSTDTTLEKILELQKINPKVHFLTFSRNFGYQASILAGMTYSRGDAAIVIDVDCEDPPELILEFLKKWEEGYDICYGIRGKRDEPAFVTWMRRMFYRVLKLTADTEIILDMAEFSLLDKRVRSVLVGSKNTFPFLRAEIAYSGFKKIGIPYDRQKRIIGQSHYNLRGMIVFGAAGIMSVSTFPLRLSFYFLPILILINLVVIVLSSLDIVNLYKSVAVFDFLYLAMLLSAQGLYIARIYKNSIGRPVFIVDWELSDSRLGN